MTTFVDGANRVFSVVRLCRATAFGLARAGFAGAAARHKAADKDGDGKVTVWEFRAARRW
jgi:hypothetical protein